MHTHQKSSITAALGLVVASLGILAAQGDIALPNQPDSVKFAIIGDSGTGSDSQYRVARQLMTRARHFHINSC